MYAAGKARHMARNPPIPITSKKLPKYAVHFAALRLPLIRKNPAIIEKILNVGLYDCEWLMHHAMKEISSMPTMMSAIPQRFSFS